MTTPCPTGEGNPSQGGGRGGGWGGGAGGKNGLELQLQLAAPLSLSGRLDLVWPSTVSHSDVTVLLFVYSVTVTFIFTFYSSLLYRIQFQQSSGEGVASPGHHAGHMLRPPFSRTQTYSGFSVKNKPGLGRILEKQHAQKDIVRQQNSPLTTVWPGYHGDRIM